MGAASSIDGEEDIGHFQQDGFATSFAKVDDDGSGCVDREEFALAAKTLGIKLTTEEADAAFLEFDADASGLVDQEEFVRFCVAHSLRSHTEELPEDTDLGSIAPFLSAENAQHGFRTAHMILDKNKKACSVPMATKPPPGSSQCCLDAAAYARSATGEGEGGGAASAAAATAAFQAAAEPLIVRIVELYPAAASLRVMEGVRFSLGSLPVEYAISRGWSAAVVKAILKANPQAAQTLDPVKKSKKFDPKEWKPDNIKGCRWLRKIGEELTPPASDDVLRLLPKPSKDTPPKWVDGQTVEDDQKEKERKKEEKRLKAEKRKAAKEAKAKAKADKAAAKAAKEAAVVAEAAAAGAVGGGGGGGGRGEVAAAEAEATNDGGEAAGEGEGATAVPEKATNEQQGAHAHEGLSEEPA